MNLFHNSSRGLFVLIALLFSNSAFAEAECKPAGCKACKTIYQRYFCDHHHQKPLVIRKAGKYCLGENINYAPKHTQTAAIVIDADNVTLDLCGFELKQTNDTLQTIGILVKTGHENVSIIGSNGVVRNFSQLGIYVQGGTQNIQLGDESTLYVVENGGVSPTAFGVVGAGFLEGGIEIGESEYWAVAGLCENHGLINNLRMKNCIVERNSAGGVFVGNGNDFRFSNCSMSYNTNSRVNGVRFFARDPGNIVPTVGISHLSSRFHGDPILSGWIIEDCIVNNNEADGTDHASVVLAFCDGLSYEEAENMVVKNSQFNNNKASGCIVSVARGYGFGGGGCIHVENCEACGNTSGFDAEGFHQSGFLPAALSTDPLEIYRTESVVYEHCIASGNTVDLTLGGPNSPNFGTATGYTLAFSDGGSLIDCLAESNKVLVALDDNTFSGYAAGVHIFGTTDSVTIFPVEDIVLKGLQASNNTCDATNAVAGAAMSAGILIDDSFSQNIAIIDSVLTQNTILDESLGTRTDVGIAMLTGAQPDSSLVSIKNCLISNNRSANIYALDYDRINVQNCEISQSDVGVLLDLSDCSSILENTFLHNGVAVVDVGTSTANPSTSLVASNQAFDNGIGSTGTTYDVWYAFGPAPTTSNDLTVGFPPLPTVDGENREVLGSCTPVPPLSVVDRKTKRASVQKLQQKALQLHMYKVKKK